MNIDEIAYELYTKDCINDETLLKFGILVKPNYIDYNGFLKHKNFYDKYYKQALIIERIGKIKKIYEH